MPAVSIVVPNYNHASFLRQRINTILAQTYQDFELILLDDCSTDDSRAILHEYASDSRVTHLVLNETNSGSTFKQWNKGVRLARGKYVWIAESDDYADPKFLARLVAVLDSDPELAFVYCRSWRVSAAGCLDGYLDSCLSHLGPSRWTKDFRATGIDECRTYLVRCCTVLSASSVVFRRDLYWRVGGADERLCQCGDWKMWASLALAGGDIFYSSEALSYSRVHDQNATEKNRRCGIYAAEGLEVVRWILRGVQPEVDVLASVRCGLANHWIPVVLNRRLPLKTRKSILKQARLLDPGALRRLARALADRLYYRLLDLSYAPRHAVGLNRRRTAGSGGNPSQ